MKSDVAERMEKISEIFLSAQNNAQKITNLDLLIVELDNTDEEFRCVAYESASMVVAAKDIEEYDSLLNWKYFLEKSGSKYATYIHVGLGWALAQHKNVHLSLIKELEPIMQLRALDGYGFYDSILRKRKTIDQKIIPECINDEMLYGYDQGVGRRLYYFTKGNVITLQNMVNSFPTYRQENIWRGIGLACAFVGGCEVDVLKKIFSIGNQQQLMLGATIVADARQQSHTITESIILICDQWFKRSIHEILQTAATAKNTIKQTEQNIYIAWLDNLLIEFTNQEQTNNPALVTKETKVKKQEISEHELHKHSH